MQPDGPAPLNDVSVNGSDAAGAAADVGWRVRAVINQHSGTGAQIEAMEPALRAVAEIRGWDVSMSVVPAADLDRTLKEIVAQKPDVLIIGGGDGSIRAALARVMDTQTVLGIIPMGTMNFVAKDLHIPVTTGEAIASLATAVVREVDVGEVNGSHFFHSSAIGIVPTLAEKREEIREANGFRARLRGLAEAVRTAAQAQPVSLVLEHDGERENERTFSLIVANNPLSSDPLTPYRRHVVDGGELSAYIARHEGRWGIARLLLTFGSGWWFWDRSITEIKASSLRVKARRRRIAVSNDGEVEMLNLPLWYKVHPRAVRVLAPPHQPPPPPPPPEPLLPHAAEKPPD